MNATASRYLLVETGLSGLSNAVLNFAAAYVIFHGRVRIPTMGSDSLLLDSIGETFIVTFLSVLIPSIIARHRRRAGTLLLSENRNSRRAGNLCIRALVLGLIFTTVCVALNALLLPRIFPKGVSFADVLLFKTLYGAVVGLIATWLALRKALNEVV